MPGLLDGLVVIGVMLLLARAWSLAAAKGAAKSQRFSVGVMAALAAIALFMVREFGLAVPVGFVAWVLLFGSHSPQRSWYGAGYSARSSTEARNAPSPASGGMSRKEAFSVLGLQEGASAADIRAAHRRLILQTHPDKGGSSYLAAKINQAKDILLG
jgi:DnaJ-domain-containing protein 1